MAKLTKTIPAIRVSEELHDIYTSQVMLSGYTPSEFLRYLLSRYMNDPEQKVVILPQDKALSLIYHINKVGNNFNQIAYRLNLDNMENKVSDETYKSVLTALKKIEAKLDALLSVTMNDKKAKREDEGLEL